MKNYSKINVIEALSLCLVLSYLFIHNIYLVLLGISLSLYLINSDLINKSLRSINQTLINIIAQIDLSKFYKAKESTSKQIDLNKNNSELTLVEIIEELGFIPSPNEHDDTNVV